MSPEALTAFISGIAAVLSAFVSLHLERRRAEKICDRRVAEVRDSILKGWEMGRG